MNTSKFSKRLSILFFLFVALTLCGQKTPQLTDDAQISVLTAAAYPQELYSAFGHTAFRVEDPNLGIDVVYNYGTFDFNQPNFYLNFAKGRMLYTLSRTRFNTFIYGYQLENRWIKGQVMDLTPEETNELFQFFEWNYLPENRDYRYDPLYDNCSTIVRDILWEHFGNTIVFDNSHIKNNLSFRQLTRNYLLTNSWGAFGIDLAWGAVVDQPANHLERMFLPYETMYQLRNTKKSSEPLLAFEQTILNLPELEHQPTLLTAPLLWFILVVLAILFITVSDHKKKRRSRWFDFSVFLITGVVGILLLLLWMATDHVYTKSNFNTLWLFPFNAIFAFMVIRKGILPKWVIVYCYLLLLLLAIVVVLWIFKVQLFSPLIIPLMLGLSIRYLFLIRSQNRLS